MEATCDSCGKGFEAKRSSAKYCSPTCRKRASRRQPEHGGEPQPESRPSGGDGMPLLVAATLDELVKAGRLHTALGQAALVLAAKAGSSFDTGSATASVVRELRATLQAALVGAQAEGDPLDELRTRRDRKRAG